jgi:hypothetical protein
MEFVDLWTADLWSLLLKGQEGQRFVGRRGEVPEDRLVRFSFSRDRQISAKNSYQLTALERSSSV